MPQMTGVGSAYEPPPMPELVLRTDQQSVSACVDLLVNCLLNTPYGNT
jgi:adenylylsulfate kinase-like enzyme